MITPEMAENEATPRKIARIWLLAAAVLGIIVLGDLNRRMTDSRRLEQDSNLLQTEVAWLESENERLQTRLAQAEAIIEVQKNSRSYLD